MNQLPGRESETMIAPAGSASAAALGGWAAATAGRRWLEAGAWTSFAVALLHVGCLVRGEAAARFFGAPRFVLAMVQQGSLAIIPVLLVVVGVLGTFGLYAWSAAGRMRRLPALRTGLITVGVIYTLRGLLLFPQLAFVSRHPGVLPWQFPVFSAVSLALGAVHLIGAARRWRALRPVGC
jgi:hypothetical protein